VTENPPRFFFRHRLSRKRADLRFFYSPYFDTDRGDARRKVSRPRAGRNAKGRPSGM